jgi:hypothetical protein
MKTYLYTGPLTAVTLSDGTSAVLNPNTTVSLPEDNEFVKTLVAMKRLTLRTMTPSQ